MPIQAAKDPNQNPTLNPARNPSINPRHNASLNPAYNASINPAYNASLNPSYNASLNPAYNASINPAYNATINPAYNATIDPNRNPIANPHQNPNFTGFFVWTRALQVEGFFIKASDDIYVIYSMELERQGLAIRNGNYGFHLVDTSGRWVGYLVPDGQKGFLRFTPRAEWNGLVV